jgi:hypothetical protein
MINNQKENNIMTAAPSAAIAGKAMTKAQEMKMRLAAAPKAADQVLRLSANNLNNL